MRLGMIGFAGLFSGSFWSGFRYQTPQAIEDQLKKQNPQLSVLLNQEEVIQEVKSGSNTKLQQFFASHLFEMIDLITVMPESDVHQRGHKFPFVVAQILNCDSQIILDAFFKAPQTEDSAKVNEKQEEEEENLSENQDFQGDGQGVSEIKNLTQDNFDSKDGNVLDSLMKIASDGSSNDQKKRYQDDDEEDDDEEGEEEGFNKFQQEEENDDKGPLLIKDIDGDDQKEEEPNEEDKDEEIAEKKDKEEEVVAAPADDAAEEVEEKVEEVKQQKQEKEQTQEKEDEGEGEGEEVSEPQSKDQADVSEQDSNDNKQIQDGILIGDEEEKALPSLQTVESTTCETHQRYRFQYLAYLFKFLDQRENRPASPTSSIASETTTATNTEQDNTTATPQVQQKKVPEDTELNNVLSGYFAKLVIHFVIKRPKEFFTFLSEKPQCLYSMTQHLYSRGISDALMKILVCQNHGIEDSGMSLYQEMRNNVIQKIINYIDTKNTSNGIQNAVNILAELASRKPCFDIIVQPTMMEPFFEKLFDGIDNIEKKNEEGEEDIKKTGVPSIVRDLRRQGIRLVSNLMQQYRNFVIKEASKNEEDKKEKKEEDAENQEKQNFGDDDEVVIGSEMEEYDKSDEDKKEEDSEKKDNEPEQAEEKSEANNSEEEKKEQEKEGGKEAEVEATSEPSPFIECIYENFNNLIKFLNIKPFESIDTISGQVMQPFGAIRLSVIEIVVEAVRINENALNNKIIESKVLTKLLHFFGEYEWNSLLHFKLDLMFLHIINNAESCSQLLHSVIEQSHLIQYILQLAKADLYKLQNKTSREIERGFFPYILRILDALKRQSEKSSYIDDHIKAHEEEWNQVWAQKIEPKQKKYAKQLGGVNPNAKKNLSNNQTDSLTLPSSLSNETKKESDDDDINNKFSSFDKKGNDDDDDDEDNVENEPEEEIRNKGDMDDDDDDEDDVFGENSRYSQKMGGNRANMLASNDSYQRHRDLYVQTNNSNTNEDDEDEDMGSGNTFQGWNVEDPKTLLQKEQKTKKKDKKKKGGSDLNQAFDSKRDEDENNFYMDNDEDDYERSSQDFASFEFNSLRNEFNSSSGGFSADEFGQFQSGDEFYDAKDSKEEIVSSEEFSKKEKQVESAYNDFNYWKTALQYDLNQLMNEM